MCPGWMTATEVSLSCHPSLMFGSTARTVLTQSGGKEVGRNLKFQATRVCAVNCFSATHSRTPHPSDSPPQRDGSSCPSRARKRAPKSMRALLRQDDPSLWGGESLGWRVLESVAEKQLTAHTLVAWNLRSLPSSFPPDCVRTVLAVDPNIRDGWHESDTSVAVIHPGHIRGVRLL